jgi:hypothetical protein
MPLYDNINTFYSTMQAPTAQRLKKRNRVALRKLNDTCKLTINLENTSNITVFPLSIKLSRPTDIYINSETYRSVL